MSNHINQQRRKLIKLALIGGASSLCISQNKLNLISSALANEYSAINDYKSLVCIYQRGGNDAFNMLVPLGGTEYSNYQKIRRQLAIAKSSLLPLTETQYGFHPSMPLIQDLYNQGQLALMANTGVLFHPTTQDNFRENNLIPPSLFSHSHQMESWQTGHASDSTVIHPGWGGLLADRLQDANLTTAGLPPTISTSGTNLWQTGEITRQLGVSASGIDNFKFFSENPKDRRTEAFEKIMQMSPGHPLQAQMEKTINISQDRFEELKRAIKSSPDLTTEFNEKNPIAKQLRMVAKLISVREQLGMKRQLFFVGANSWDTHSNQMEDHAELLTLLDDGIGSFQETLNELDSMDIAKTKSITTYTASEFGRTLSINGDGTDHGWASSYLIFGGAVQGAQIYGNVPSMEIGGENDAFEANEAPAGRFIPENSVDQYGSTLAQWLGISEKDLPKIFPNLDNFKIKNLGFMG
ncbi:MAG: DUF1501 domain-containing protein [Methylococcales bacterium]